MSVIASRPEVMREVTISSQELSEAVRVSGAESFQNFFDDNVFDPLIVQDYRGFPAQLASALKTISPDPSQEGMWRNRITWNQLAAWWDIPETRIQERLAGAEVPKKSAIAIRNFAIWWHNRVNRADGALRSKL